MHKAPAAKITVPMTDPNVTIRTPRDPNTLSNYHNFLTKHTVAEFEIDFEKKMLNGGVELTFESLTESEAKELSLDTRFVSSSSQSVGAKAHRFHVCFRNADMVLQLPGHHRCQIEWQGSQVERGRAH
jgi:leukotriene-A4 hydrolase